MKKALITGITGQDGSYLAELLLDKGYEVHGIRRRSSSFNTGRIDHLYADPHTLNTRLILHYGDLTDTANLSQLIANIRPDEIYNLGAQSHVGVSFQLPEYSANVDALGTLRILEGVRSAKLTEHTRIYQASTSELFGKVQEIPQKETTPFYPRSPYAVAKMYAYWITVNYREAYNMFACNGVLFNHESPRRGETFVTRKITRALTRIKCGLQETLYLGNMDALRDWGHARDYVQIQWLMLQQDKPDDYIIATGNQISVREFVQKVALKLEMHLEWLGGGLEERAHWKTGSDEKCIIKVDPDYYRPTEVETLLGDATKAHKQLGWRPKSNIDQLIEEMVDCDMILARQEMILRKGKARDE